MEAESSSASKMHYAARLIATTLPRNASEKTLPLKELFANLVLYWDKVNNEFAIEQEAISETPTT